MKPFLTLALLASVHAVHVTLAQTAVSTSAGATSASAVTPATGPKRTVALSADQKAVSDTERRRFAAQIRKDDAVLEQVLSDDLIYVHSQGQTDGKAPYIQSIRDGKLRYDAIDVQDETIRIYGNTAVVNGVCLVKATSNGETIHTRLRYTDVYVRKGRQWQMVAYQSMRLAN